MVDKGRAAIEYNWEKQMPLLRWKEHRSLPSSFKRPFGRDLTNGGSSSQKPPLASPRTDSVREILREMTDIITAAGAVQFKETDFRTGPRRGRSRNGQFYEATLCKKGTQVLAKKVAGRRGEDAKMLLDRVSREVFLGHLAAQSALLQRRPRVCGSLGFCVSEEGEVWILTPPVPGCDLQEFAQSPLFWARTLDAPRDEEGSILARYVMPEGKRWQLCLEVASAMMQLREMQVAHCDVRPCNLMVGAGDRLLLVDFGQARRVSDDACRSTPGVEVRKDSYDAPELRSGSGIPNKHSDMYSAAVVMVSIWTGSMFHKASDEESPPAGQGGTAEADAMLIGMAGDNQDLAEALRGMHRDPATLADLRRLCKTQPMLATLLARCLAASPSDRPHPRHVRDELAEIAQGTRSGKKDVRSGGAGGLDSEADGPSGSASSGHVSSVGSASTGVSSGGGAAGCESAVLSTASGRLFV